MVDCMFCANERKGYVLQPNVLIVEDDPEIANLLTVEFGRLGYTLSTTATGAGALKRCCEPCRPGDATSARQQIAGNRCSHGRWCFPDVGHLPLC